MWAENISRKALIDGLHHYPGENAMLIQIVDPDMDFVKPKIKFRKEYQYKFLDIEDNPPASQFGVITDSQADDIANNIREARNNHMNVIVSCVAGLCRSGAIVDVAVAFGWWEEIEGVLRIPNYTVKRKLIRNLIRDTILEDINGR